MYNCCSDRTRHGCPASFYLGCSGYEKGLNCWEVDEKPCCSNSDFSICLACKVYMECQAKV